jgi:hypothetical protein
VPGLLIEVEAFSDRFLLYCAVCGKGSLPRQGELRKNTKFEIPTDKQEIEPAVSSVTYSDTLEDRVRIKKELDLPPSFQAMQNRGVKFTNVDIRDGANRPMRKRNEYEEYYY